MIDDARNIPADTILETDICIVGAGAAGLTLAHVLRETRSHVLVLESGGLRYEHFTQSLSRGQSVGAPYEALDLCRVRQFGGTTGRAGWGGWCKPFDAEDFERRQWLPLSGWPVSRADLDRWYAEAAQLLGVDLDDRSSSAAPFPSMTDLFVEKCHMSPRPDIGATLLPVLRGARNIRVLLHATAIRLTSGPDGDIVRSVEIVATRTKRLQVRAKLFVLAGGGIENARLLLLSKDTNESGLGNQYGTVGRYFMEHPRVVWGTLEAPPSDTSLARFDPALPSKRPRYDGSGLRTKGPEGFGLALKREACAEMQLLGSRTWIRPSAYPVRSQGVEALEYLTFWLRKGRLHRELAKSAWQVLLHPSAAATAGMARLAGQRRPPDRYRFTTILEQEPDALSRITLDSKCDRFGMPQARLHWHISGEVRRTLQQVQMTIVREMRRLGYACHTDAAAHQPQEPEFTWVRHHMGTTRMSENPRFGVVDGNCKVHGVRNLYSAGSSVFPTGGNDMPTMTIVALAFRLAHHLRSIMAEEDIGVRTTAVMVGDSADEALPIAARTGGEII
jgi:choline dehydrogenase-like flavoprotein